MNTATSPIRRNTGRLVGDLILGAGLTTFAVIVYINKGGIGWAILLLIIGLGSFGMAMEASMAVCPHCGHQFSKVGGLDNYFECPKCENYLRKLKQERRIEVVDKDYIAPQPVFKWTLPWNGFNLPGVQTPAITVMPSLKGQQQLQAHWPEECCICGSPVSHYETVSKVFGVTPGSKSGAFRSPIDKNIAVTVSDIPHCDHHTGGAQLLVACNSDGESNGFLAFRSFSFYRQFKEMNRVNRLA